MSGSGLSRFWAHVQEGKKGARDVSFRKSLQTRKLDAQNSDERLQVMRLCHFIAGHSEKDLSWPWFTGTAKGLGLFPCKALLGEALLGSWLILSQHRLPGCDWHAGWWNEVEILELCHLSAWGAQGRDHWTSFVVTRQSLAGKQVLKNQGSMKRFNCEKDSQMPAF